MYIWTVSNSDSQMDKENEIQLLPLKGDTKDNKHALDPNKIQCDSINEGL